MPTGDDGVESELNMLVTLVVACFIVGGGISYYLGRRKTRRPIVAGVLGAFLSIIPVLGLIYIVVLATRDDLPQDGGPSD